MLFRSFTRLLELLLFWFRRTERELLLTVFEFPLRTFLEFEFRFTVDLLLELFENVDLFLLATLPRLVSEDSLLLKLLLYANLLPYR